MLEKIIAALSYITGGFVGFFWLLLALFTKNSLKPYLSYHVFQSIFLSFLFFIISIFLKFVMSILSIIPFAGQVITRFGFYLNMPIMLFFGYSIIEAGMFALVFYLVVTCLQGKYSYLPWVSNIIRANIRNN